MKVLLDTCLSPKIRATLDSLGFDTSHTADLSVDPGDDAILDTAYAENRVLITLDKDFGELAVSRRKAHYGIVRLAGLSIAQQTERLPGVLTKYGAELQQGAIVTIESARVRIREP